MAAIRLDKLLKSALPGGLQNIVQNAQIMQGLTAALKEALAPEVADELVAASLRDDGELVVIASSSAWAAKLRFEETALLQAARQTGAVANSLKVAVSRQG